MNPIPIGPFDCRFLLGKGGMGEVWRGNHVEQGIPVAIKVITRAHARKPQFLRSFRSEVQNVARLNHPGIVMVLDYGQISPEADRLSNGTLVAGSPYLVMEYASGGTLEHIDGPLPWTDVRFILVSLLDALAHAHARGVIHRDLKPANVLLASAGDSRPGLKLTDFGIAHALEEEKQEDGLEMPTGTPQYMAPEQFQGFWRDYGPWTDLYALGVIAFRLATGRLPFEQGSYVELALAHLNQTPPRFRNTFELPKGFESWVRTLLQKDPTRRFQRAADAAHGLLSLPDTADLPYPAEETLGISLERRLTRGPTGQPTPATTLAWLNLRTARTLTLKFEHTLPPVPDTGPMVTTGFDRRPIRPRQNGLDGEEAESPPPMTPVSPPFTEQWRSLEPPASSLQLVGAGLGLYGLRPIPLVDRNPERDQIWNDLYRVHDEIRARLILVHGAAGFGKSRLVEWICERAHELGTATILKATHSPAAGPTEGLAWLVARHLRCIGLTRPALLQRTKRLLKAQGVTEEYEWEALTEIMQPATPSDFDEGVRLVRFRKPEERYVLIHRLLQRLTRERPVILWLDDVQWCSDSIEFSHYLMNQSSSLRVLLLLTVRDEALPERPLESRLLDDLLELPRTQRLLVGPLTPSDHFSLVEALLYLESDLAGQIETRTGGNPLFAVQLVGDLVRRGVFEITSNGFSLKAGEHAHLPDDLHTVWSARIERLLDEYSHRSSSRSSRVDRRKQGEQALELAAILGQHVDSEEWREACGEAGIPYSEDLSDLLVSSHLATWMETGWSFVHGMLRESVERIARDRDRWATHHRICARMLQKRDISTSPSVNERLGRHLFYAGDLGEALQPLLEGAEERFNQPQCQQALDLITLREEALDKLDIEESDIRRIRGWLVHSKILNRLGNPNDALKWARRAYRNASALKQPNWIAETLSAVNTVLLNTGQMTDALASLQKERDLYERLDDPRGLAACLRNLGVAAVSKGNLSDAWTLFEEARSWAQQHGDQNVLADCLMRLGSVAKQQGHLELARQLIEEAYTLHIRLGNRFDTALCLNDLGDVLRMGGDLTGAEKRYRKSLNTCISLGLDEYGGIYPRLNLCLVLLQQRHFEEARLELESLKTKCARKGWRIVVCHINCLLLMALAANRDWDAWDGLLEEAHSLLETIGVAEHDAAWALQRAGELSYEAGETTRAAQAFEMALSLWSTLGNQDKVLQTRTALGRCKP